MLNEYLQSGLKAAKGVYKSAKYQMEGLSEIEIKTRECTNSDPWGAHGKDLAVLARATHNREEMYLIMKTLWLRLEEREEKWRHCYKALNVIEYLVAHGHESCVKELKQNVRSIEYLDTFKFKDSSGRDQGINVRQKSATLVSLLRDDERIAEAREKARRNRGKYSGISADDVRSGSYNRPEARGGSSYERDGRDGDRYASGDGWRDDRAAVRDGRDDYASRDRLPSSRDRDNGDREFRAFSAAPAPAAPAAPVVVAPVASSASSSPAASPAVRPSPAAALLLVVEELRAARADVQLQRALVGVQQHRALLGEGHRQPLQRARLDVRHHHRLRGLVARPAQLLVDDHAAHQAVRGLHG